MSLTIGCAVVFLKSNSINHLQDRLNNLVAQYLFYTVSLIVSKMCVLLAYFSSHLIVTSDCLVVSLPYFSLYQVEKN